MTSVWPADRALKRGAKALAETLARHPGGRGKNRVRGGRGRGEEGEGVRGGRGGGGGDADAGVGTLPPVDKGLEILEPASHPPALKVARLMDEGAE